MKIDLGSIGIILLVGILFYLSVREPLPSAIVGAGITAANPKVAVRKAALRNKAAVTRKKTVLKQTASRTRSTQQKKQTQARSKATTIAAKPVLTPAQKAAIAARQAVIRKNRVLILHRRMNLRIKLAVLKAQQQQKLGGYRTIDYGQSIGGALTTQLPGTTHGGLGVGGGGSMIDVIKNDILGKKIETPDAWMARKEKECAGNTACTERAMRIYDSNVEDAVNASISQNQAQAVPQLRGQPDPTQARA